MDRRAFGKKRWWEQGFEMSELVRLTDLTKIYQGGGTGALNGVPLAIREGEFTAIMGPSGSGKAALRHLPTVLVAAERKGALDTKSGGQVMALFAELHQEGQTTVLVTHAPKLATRYAARVISMLDGRVIDDARLETTERNPADVIRVR